MKPYEQHEKFKFGSKTYIKYRYRDADGEVFSCLAVTLEQAREQRDKWLSKRKEDKQ